MGKRLRRKPYKDGELCVYWGMEERGANPDILIQRGNGVPKCDGALASHILCSERLDCLHGPTKLIPSFIEELRTRGYDITTFKFSIQKVSTND